MEPFALIFGIVILVLIGAGLAVGLVACGLAIVLIALGVVSSSFLIGIRNRPAAGIRAFFLQCGVLIGIPAGAFCAWFADAFFTVYGSSLPLFIYGGAAGTVAGILIALTLDYATRQMHAWASARLPFTRSTAVPKIEPAAGS